MSEGQENPEVNALDIAREITVAWLSNPNVNAAASDVPTFLKAMHATISELSSGQATDAGNVSEEFVPAVPVRSSVKPDYIVSLINGRKFKTLKRHLALHGLTPGEYRERYGLKSDYPMVAASYSEHRREVARKLGLGRKPARAMVQEQPAAMAVVVEPAPAKPKREPARARQVKAAVPIAKTSSEPIASEKAEAASPGFSEAINNGAVLKPARTKRSFARPSTAQIVVPAEDAVASPPKPKKPRAAAKPKVVPKAADGPEVMATLPKRGRSKKSLAEA